MNPGRALVLAADHSTVRGIIGVENSAPPLRLLVAPGVVTTGTNGDDRRQSSPPTFPFAETIKPTSRVYSTDAVDRSVIGVYHG